ncbi:MAG: ABC transporter ATP-binding protein, partial [Proteobacteria bacterium]|nr:ABC transporter ATP-binding protein [Pseudomonadota bacterium]
IGPNGAGKTTIFNCLNRYYNLDTGRFVFQGRTISKVAPHKVAELGIARTFQNIELFKNTTVIHNLLLGRHRHRKTNLLSEAFFTPKARRGELAAREKAEEVIDFLDLQAYRDQQVANLPYGVQKTVELARALTMDPELLLLDEPSSGLNVEETQDLLFWIEDIKVDLGITIIIVEHNMKMVNEISDQVLALNFGEVLTLGTPDDVLNHPEVQKAYLGEESALT